MVASEKKKERVELQFNLSSETEKELLDFIDQNGTTRAGFIKSIVRQYMNTIRGMGKNAPSEPIQQPQTSKRKEKRKVPKLGSSFSSKDFE